MARSFAAEDFHLLPKHQLAWRSQNGVVIPSVEAVCLAVPAGDQRDLAGVGDDHLVAETRHQPAHPGRAWPCLQHHP